jgi:hypothetical protein
MNLKYRNYVAQNPLLRKSHVHTEKQEDVKRWIDDEIRKWDFDTPEGRLMYVQSFNRDNGV